MRFTTTNKGVGFQHLSRYVWRIASVFSIPLVFVTNPLSLSEASNSEGNYATNDLEYWNAAIVR